MHRECPAQQQQQRSLQQKCRMSCAGVYNIILPLHAVCYLAWILCIQECCRAEKLPLQLLLLVAGAVTGAGARQSRKAFFCASIALLASIQVTWREKEEGAGLGMRGSRIRSRAVYGG